MVNNMMACVFMMGWGTFLWVLFGHTMAFGGNGSVIGSFDHILLNGISLNDLLDPTAENGSIPTYVFSAFQMTFAIITPTIIAGSVAGRMRFKSLFIFLGLWSLIVYYPMAHMVWGEGGLLGSGWLGAADFAGGTVVHISSGLSGLVLCLLVGKRQNYERAIYRIHNIPLVMLGMALLWFGWFGFNVGSNLAANEMAGHVFFTTVISSGVAMTSWMLIDVIKQGKPTLVGASTGVVAGLVAITPACGFVPVWASLVIGALVSPVCYFGIHIVKKVLKIDDALDAFGCHGIGGLFGALVTGLFAASYVNGVDGLFYGDARQFGVQVTAVLITIVWVVAGSLLAAGITRMFGPLRVEAKDELLGMDMTQHGESAYPSFNGLD
jgi:Amt family ammonium transporter